MVTDDGGCESFDYAILACHSDQALRLLADPTASESEVLGAIQYQDNEAILHTDRNVLPRRRRAWASWNYYLAKEPRQHVAVTYNMNILQRLASATTYCVTLNDTDRIAADRVIKRMQYQHPMYTRGTVAAQARQSELNADRTFYCGAYWKNGFHEDGVVSALAAVEHLKQRTKNAELHLRRAG